jgi:hypothetical protein
VKPRQQGPEARREEHEHERVHVRERGRGKHVEPIALTGRVSETPLTAERAGTSARCVVVSTKVRIALALCALLLIAAAAGCSGDEETRPATAPPDLPRGTVLGIVWRGNKAVLQRFDRTALTPRPARVPLGQSGGTWSFSPANAKLAVAGGPPLEVRIVDVRRLRLEKVVTLPGNLVRPPAEPAVIGLAWPTTRRILALVEWGAWHHAVVVVDPGEHRAVSHETVDGTLVGYASTEDGLVLLLAPVGRIGPTRLLLIDRDGETESIPLSGIHGGHETVDADQAVTRVQIPALALAPTGRRALVVPAAGDVAEIDLVSGRVVSRALHEPVSLLGRVRSWLEPTAQAKASAGTERQAAWVGDHLVAVTGQDHRLVNGHDEQETRPAGLTLIDVRDWSLRVLDERASQFSAAAGTLLAYGISGSSATQDTIGMGLTAYGLDGEEHFHLFGDEPIYFVETANPLAYVWRDGASPAVVDLRSGSVIGRLDRYSGDDLPALVVP